MYRRIAKAIRRNNAEVSRPALALYGAAGQRLI